MPDHHLLGVWNPSYAADAMDAHLRRRYDASDRKYQGARPMAARELKADYARRVSRRQPRQS